MRRFAKRC
jgi:translation initiation factor IF-1